MKTLRILSLLFMCALVCSAQQPKPEALNLKEVDAFAEQLRAEWKVPGIGLGILRDGKIVVAKGYGYRNIEEKLPFTTKTLFPIGSTTKSFTALSLAILKDRGKVDWDDRVRRYVPTYELQDPVASERMTIRDLLLHRSGLARHDLVWYSSDFTRKEILDRLKDLEMGPGFRNTFQYNNLGYMTAGYVAGEIGGKGWEQLVRESILLPLEMNSTNFADAESQKSSDHALPYDELDGRVQRIPFASTDAVGPAGSLHSNVDEILHYVQMLLSKGKYNGKQVVSEANLQTIQSPQIVMASTSPVVEMSPPMYGMGWVIQAYRGHRYVWHNGGIDGFYTLIALLPDDQLGVVVLTNRLDRVLAEVLARRVFDQALGLSPIDWDQRYKDVTAKAKQAEAEEAKSLAEERKPGTHPSHALADYAGTFTHPAYGTVTIASEGERLKLTFNRLVTPLEHYHYDVFLVPHGQRPLGDLKVKFVTSSSGAIDSVSLPVDESLHDIVFQRVKPAAKPE